MAIAREALERFLERKLPKLPPFKGAEPAWLETSILADTGMNYQPHTLTPRAPQLEGLACALHLGRALLFYDMRMGKTKIGLDYAAHLKRVGMWRGKGLIIAHAPIGVDVWKNWAAQDSDLKLQGVVAGDDAIPTLLDFMTNDADLLVVPWSMLQALFGETRQSRKGKPKEYAAYDRLRLFAPSLSLVIIDEIHRCQDHTSLRFTIAKELVTHCEFRLGLSGTPSGRNPYAIWAQTFLIDSGATFGRSYHFFEAAFGKNERVYLRGGGGAYVHKLKFDNEKLPLLHQWLATISIAYKRDEVIKESITHNVTTLRFSREQGEAYDAQLELAREIREDDTRALENVFIRLRQISAGFLPFNDEEGDKRTVVFPKCPKRAYVRQLATDMREFCSNVQYVIFYEYTPAGEALAATLTEAGASFSWLSGRTGSKRGAVLADFQQGRAQVLLAQSQTAAEAIDLPMADYLLFFDSPASPTVRAQCEARPMSRGIKPLLIEDLVASPADRRTLEHVREGKETLRAVLFGPRKFYKLLARQN